MLCFIMLSSCVQLIWYVIFMSIFAAHWYPFGSFCFLLVSYVWYPSYWFLLSCVHVNATLLLISHCPCLPLLTYCYCPCFLLSKSSYWFLTVHVCLANLFLSLILISLLYLFHLPSSDLSALLLISHQVSNPLLPSSHYCLWLQYLTDVSIWFITVSGIGISFVMLISIWSNFTTIHCLSCYLMPSIQCLTFDAFYCFLVGLNAQSMMRISL